jgi:hypothetical protein
MAMVTEAFAHLSKKVAAGEVTEEVLAKVGQLTNDVVNRNFASANAVQTVRMLQVIYYTILVYIRRGYFAGSRQHCVGTTQGLD